MADSKPKGPQLREEVEKELPLNRRPPRHVPSKPKAPGEQIVEHEEKNPKESAWLTGKSSWVKGD